MQQELNNQNKENNKRFLLLVTKRIQTKSTKKLRHFLLIRNELKSMLPFSSMEFGSLPL
jgi:hypothetical protein